MIAHVTMAAAVGKKLSLGEAWAATAGKRWRLIGLVALLGLLLVLIIALYVLLWVAVVSALDAGRWWSSGCCRSPRSSPSWSGSGSGSTTCRCRR